MQIKPAAAQLSVAIGEQSFADLMIAEGLQLATARLVPFAHWITPATMPKRFLSSVHVADAAFWRETTEGRLVLDAHEHKVMLRRPARPDLILSCGTAP